MKILVVAYFKNFYVFGLGSPALKKQVDILARYVGLGREQQPDAEQLDVARDSVGMEIKDLKMQFAPLTKADLQAAVDAKTDESLTVIQALKSYKLGRDLLSFAENNCNNLQAKEQRGFELTGIVTQLSNKDGCTEDELKAVDEQLKNIGYTDKVSC